jgi:hypothetical protein
VIADRFGAFGVELRIVVDGCSPNSWNRHTPLRANRTFVDAAGRP